MRRQFSSRRGVASVLAMLYLILFSILAVGFYAATTTSSQVVHNDAMASEAMAAAESGMDFIRYQIANVTIPHGTPADQLFGTVFNALQTQMVGYNGINSISLNGNTVLVPGSPGATISTGTGDDSPRFSITITQSGQKMTVKVTGVVSASGSPGLSIHRSIQMDYGLAEKASSIFNFGVASKGKISTGGASIIEGASDPTKGSVLSTCMSDPTPVVIGGKLVSGDISITNPTGNVTYSGASIGGTTDPTLIANDHIHKGVPDPEFPTVDTDAFKAYATNVYGGSGTIKSKQTLVNAIIPANTNPKFTGGVNIQGVLYVQAPNVVTFGGNCTIQGTIVVQNSAPGTLATNQLNFTGTVAASGVDTLPASFGDLRKLTGSFILAPNFVTNFTGNFGTVNGSIISSEVTMSGNAGGTVQGSVVNLDDTLMTVNGSSDIIIASTGTSNYPAGVFFSSHYVPLPDTYAEVK